MEQDEQHLRILSILYYVYAGLLAVMSSIGLVYVFIGAMLLEMPPAPAKGAPPPPPWLGWVFVSLGAAFTLFGWVVAVLAALAGRFLTRYQHWLYCMIISGLICVHVPLGTLLGVFTIIVLVRPRVKELFGTIPARPVELPSETPHYRTDDPAFRPGP